MNKVKTIYKLQTIILLAVMLCLIVCLTIGGTASADTNLPVINLENCEEKLENDDLFGYAGVVTDKDCIRENKAVFDDYINKQNGKVIIPERDDESNVLAYQFIGFTEEGMAVYPIYSYSKIEKSFIDYQELIRDDTILISEKDKNIMLSATNDNYSDYMSIDVSFCVYVKRYVGNYFKIGAVRMKMTIDYFPSDNPNFNSYVGRYEVYVSPSSKYTLKSFKMTPMVPKDINVNTINSETNHNAATETKSFTFNTGITAQAGMQIGSSDASISIGDSRSISMSFGYSVSAPSGASSVVEDAGIKELDNYFGHPLTVTRSGRSNSMWSTDLNNDKGKSYSGLYYATHRIRKDANGGCLGLLFSDLSLWAQAGEPSYGEDNTEMVWLLAGWEQNFNNKVILALGSSPDGDQYFEDVLASCSLPNKGSANGILIFRE